MAFVLSMDKYHCIIFLYCSVKKIQVSMYLHIVSSVNIFTWTYETFFFLFTMDEYLYIIIPYCSDKKKASFYVSTYC